MWHMRRCRAEGTLIVPEWPSQPWWPLLFPAREDGWSPVVAVEQLPPGALRPAHAETILRGGNPPFGILAVRLSFSTTRGPG